MLEFGMFNFIKHPMCRRLGWLVALVSWLAPLAGDPGWLGLLACWLSDDVRCHFVWPGLTWPELPDLASADLS